MFYNLRNRKEQLNSKLTKEIIQVVVEIKEIKTRKTIQKVK